MSIGDEFRELVFNHTGTKAEYLLGNPIILGQCPREKTDMTPCVARDGDCAMTTDECCVGCGMSVTVLIQEENERFGEQGSPEIEQQDSSKMGEAEKRGKLFADAIAAMTDLFYQVDTRDRFMVGLLERLKLLKIEMDKDRQDRRKKEDL